MAWTRETKAARLLARFTEAAVKFKELQKAVNAEEWPTEKLVVEKIAAEQRYNMLRGTLYRVIMNSTSEL